MYGNYEPEVTEETYLIEEGLVDNTPFCPSIVDQDLEEQEIPPTEEEIINSRYDRTGD